MDRLPFWVEGLASGSWQYREAMCNTAGVGLTPPLTWIELPAVVVIIIHRLTRADLHPSLERKHRH